MSKPGPSPLAARTSGLVRIESVTIRDFRGIDSCTVRLDPSVTLLVGRNSAGKSRILRAIAIACGTLSANGDDFTVGSQTEPSIDLVLAPGETTEDAPFDARIGTLFGQHVQLYTLDGGERVAWRTTIRHSAEGWGGRAEATFMRFDATASAWEAPPGQVAPTRNHRAVVAGDFIDTGRDLAAELSRPGSPVRRVLDDLDVVEVQRTSLETDLQDLGTRIVAGSGTLSAVRNRLSELEAAVGGIGAPDVRALPARLEELVRMIEIALDTGAGGLPLRLHGAGARSLTSLQVQSVLYDRRLGRDGTDIPTHAVTLLEEPEAHLHPQACFELGELLQAVPGQVVASTHSSHLVTVVPTNALRLVRATDGRTVVQDLSSTDDSPDTPAARRIGVSAAEWEKLKRSIERPFGEVLFANAIVVGDGATERGFLPHVIRKALGNRAAGICVVDPSAMSQATPFVKYAEAAGIPCILFVDCDPAGRRDAGTIADYAVRVWATGDRSLDGTLEDILAAHDPEWCIEQCQALMPSVKGSAEERLSQLKGVYGNPLGRSFVEAFPDVDAWPKGFRDLIAALAPAGDPE